jgi:hypothetical protein
VIPWRFGDTIASEPLTRGVEWMEVFGQHLKEQCVDRFKALSIPTGIRRYRHARVIITTLSPELCDLVWSNFRPQTECWALSQYGRSRSHE